MGRLVLSLALWACTFTHLGPRHACAVSPIEAYGQLPSVQSVTISPDGKHLAMLQNNGTEKALFVYDQRGNVVAVFNTENVKARSIEFSGPRHIILFASTTQELIGYKSNKLEYSGAVSINIEKKATTLLLGHNSDVYPAQSGLGRIVGRRHNSTDVFMPAYVGSPYSNPSYDLLRVDLESGDGQRYAHGRQSTRDWFVDTDGTILAREDFDDKKNIYSISVNKDGKLTEIFSSKSAIPWNSIEGIKRDRSAL